MLVRSFKERPELFRAPPVSPPANDRSPQGPDAPAAALLFDAVL